MVGFTHRVAATGTNANAQRKGEIVEMDAAKKAERTRIREEFETMCHSSGESCPWVREFVMNHPEYCYGADSVLNNHLLTFVAGAGPRALEHIGPEFLRVEFETFINQMAHTKFQVDEEWMYFGSVAAEAAFRIFEAGRALATKFHVHTLH